MSAHTSMPPREMQDEHPEIVRIGGVGFARLDRIAVVDRIFRSLARGEGGWVITANVDHLRRCAADLSVREMYESADLVVADGMPLVWAARLMGRPLPERVAGADLVWPIADRAAREGRSLYLLGGAPGAAEAARDRLLEAWPDLQILGASGPTVSPVATPNEVDRIAGELAAANPDIFYCALGSPKQEYLIAALRGRLPKMWMLGVGVSLSFISGKVRRAPLWMQRSGLEFFYRLIQEPRVLARRYLVDDSGFALGLLLRSWRSRGRA